MDLNTTSFLVVGLMLFLLVLGVPIAYALGFSSILVGFFAFGPMTLPKGRVGHISVAVSINVDAATTFYLDGLSYC